MTIDEVLGHLDGVKEVSRDKWVARCPCHDDARASLAVSRGERVAILMKCFSCSATFRDLMRAVEARMAGVRQ